MNLGSGGLKPESQNPMLYISPPCPWVWHLNQIARKSPAQHKRLSCQVWRALKPSGFRYQGH